MKRLYELYIHKILFASKLALAIVLGYAMVTTVIGARDTTETFTPESVSGGDTSSVELATPQASINDYSAIVEQNIFSGTANVARPGDSMANNRISNNMWSANKELGLALVGTAVVSNPTYSRALIKDMQTKTESMYKPGDLVAAGAHIKSIEDDHVVLIHEGQQKVLTIGIRSDTQGNASDVAEPRQQKVVEPVKAQSQPVHQRPTQADFNHIETVLKNAVIKPHMVNGEMDGLKITGLEKVPGAALLGLKNGDVVRTVNGHALTSRQKAFQVFKKSRSQPAIELELLRKDQAKTLSFDLR